MDLPKVVQAFAVQVYTQALDIVQQLDTLDGRAVDAHQHRVDRIIPDVAAWLCHLTSEDLALITTGHEPETPLHGGGVTEYPADAVQLVLEARIRAAAEFCQHRHLNLAEFIQATGQYLSEQTDHKKAWLAERAANLLVAGMGA
ncbi:hypothetical protein HF673_02690 [Acidithiobacillus thiooxidans]|uniref:hypothetical protein n=1 Tax=Acidithiobacillus thiooxidans TaxID=930 RepID=UPI001C06791D|nr:hypothetical protein [Acidithiobacillus thiooxidans]MBU2834715.1 hypothetical protein [Acidithiobacillus thiooxidans]